MLLLVVTPSEPGVGSAYLCSRSSEFRHVPTLNVLAIADDETGSQIVTGQFGDLINSSVGSS